MGGPDQDGGPEDGQVPAHAEDAPAARRRRTEDARGRARPEPARFSCQRGASTCRGPAGAVRRPATGQIRAYAEDASPSRSRRAKNESRRRRSGPARRRRRRRRRGAATSCGTSRAAFRRGRGRPSVSDQGRKGLEEEIFLASATAAAAARGVARRHGPHVSNQGEERGAEEDAQGDAQDTCAKGSWRRPHGSDHGSEEQHEEKTRRPRALVFDRLAAASVEPQRRDQGAAVQPAQVRDPTLGRPRGPRRSGATGGRRRSRRASRSSRRPTGRSS